MSRWSWIFERDRRIRRGASKIVDVGGPGVVSSRILGMCANNQAVGGKRHSNPVVVADGEAWICQGHKRRRRRSTAQIIEICGPNVGSTGIIEQRSNDDTCRRCSDRPTELITVFRSRIVQSKNWN